MVNFEQLGTPLDTIASSEAVVRGQVVDIGADGKWDRAAVGEGVGLSRQTHRQISSGTDVYSSSYNGYRNWFKPSEDNIGSVLAVEAGVSRVSEFDQYSGTVTANDLLYCIGSGIVASEATASGTAGFNTSPQIVVARALTGGTRTGGSGDTISIVTMFNPRAAVL